MDNPRPEKVAVVDEVRERLGAANAAILTEYRGLPVKDLEALRRSLTAAGGSYKVYKNTLVGFAARDLGLDLEPLLTGPTAIAFVDGDAAEVAKALREFARTHPLLVIKGGLLGKSVLSPADTAALADLPSREVMLARVAGAFAAPMVQFAGLLQALPRNLAYGLKALIEKGGAGGAGAAPAAADAARGAADAGDADAAPAAAAEAAGDAAPAAAAEAAGDAAPAAAAPAAAAGDSVPAAAAADAGDAAADAGDAAADAGDAAADAAPTADAGDAAATPASTDEPADGAPEPAAAPPAADDAGPLAAEAEPTAPSTDQPAEGAPEAAPGEGAPSEPEPTAPSTEQPAEGAADAAPTADPSTPTNPAQES